MSVATAFQGEIQFRRYSDSSTQGPQIVLGLSDRDELRAFIGKEGKRYMAVLVEIGDDEQPVQPAPRKDTRGPLCREACDYCAMPEFQDYAGQRFGGEASEEVAKAAILAMCGVLSRKDLDTNETAGRLFVEKFRVPFMRWQRERKQG